MKQKSFYSLLLVSVMTLTAILSSGCTEEEPEKFTTQRIVINYTDSVVDASVSPDAKTRSQSVCPTPAGGVLTSKSGKKLYLSCTETAWPSDKSVKTRGTKVTTAGISNLGVSASVYPAAYSYTSAGCGSYFYKESVSSGTPMSYYWPTTDYRISFFGYYPYNNAAFTVQSAASATGAPTYAYTVPSAIASQQDIMTGQVTNQPGGSSSPVNMTLAHRCSAIHFSITNDRSEAITVNSISIEGVKYSGTLNENTWTLGSGVNSSSTNPFTLTSNSSVAAGATVDVTGTSNVFMMLPQSLPATAKLKVVVDDEDYEMEITGIWQAGKAYTYTVSFNSYDYYLNVVGPSDYTYLGGTNNYSIQSYKQNSSGTMSKAAAWTATYDTDGDGVFDDSKPEWLTVFTASGDGSTSVTYYSATVVAQTSSESDITTSSLLSSAEEVGSSSDYYDLSTNGGTTLMTTANCYMVHAPGYYKLPLVYGNAIKNGMDNTVAYAPGGSTTTTYCANFINHVGADISGPWITKSGSGVDAGMNVTVNGAQLIWQDVDGLTTDFVIDGDYLKFQVPVASIAEGNAIIAVMSGSTIVWSWHIWVTPETYSNLTTVVTESHNYNVAPANLGWVNSGNIHQSSYAGRSCTVKISQLGGRSETFNVTQTGGYTVSSSHSGYSPYYQWGRKDAFPPSNGTNDNTDKTVYVGSGVDSKGWAYQASTTSTIGTTIQKPWRHYYNSSKYGPVNTSYYNMWDAQNTNTNNVTTATKKTIYDPCPPGFCVPTGNLWYHFGGDMAPTSRNSRSQKGYWDSTYGGKEWVLDEPRIYFPAAGYRRNNSGAIWGVTSNGNYWSATPYDNGNSRIMLANSNVWWWDYTGRSNSMSVRPVAEEE